MFKNIIVPLDGSDTSERVLGWVTQPARAMDAEVTLLAVIEDEELAAPLSGTHGGPGDRGTPPEVLSAQAESRSRFEVAADSAERYLNMAARRLRENGVTTSQMVVSGAADRQIVEVAGSFEDCMIAMVTHREHTLARGVLGSVADRVMRHAPVPVLLLRPEEAARGRPAEVDVKHIDEIIVPLDFSSAAEEAVGVAIDMASAMDASIKFVRVTARFYIPPGPGAMTQEGLVYSGARLRAEARQYLQGFVDEALDADVDAQAVVLSGSPANAIVDLARESPNSMIVMTTHGLSGFRRWLLGSVTDKVVRASERPVLVLRSYPPEAR
ncbi:MAG: universal stress protein [Chloroflexota bacterium]